MPHHSDDEQRLIWHFKWNENQINFKMFKLMFGFSVISFLLIKISIEHWKQLNGAIITTSTTFTKLQFSNEQQAYRIQVLVNYRVYSSHRLRIDQSPVRLSSFFICFSFFAFFALKFHFVVFISPGAPWHTDIWSFTLYYGNKCIKLYGTLRSIASVR